MTYSHDKRRLPRIAIGSRHEPNRYVILLAHDPVFNTRQAPRVTYPGKKVLGDGWLASRGPWLAVLHRDTTMGDEPHYAILRLVPVKSAWGIRPLDAMKEAMQAEAGDIKRVWNEEGVKPTRQEDVFFTNWWTGRTRP